MILEIVVLFLSILLYLMYQQRRPQKFPPGPISWPVFGNLIQVCRNLEPYKSVMQMRKKYGDIIAIDLGYCRTVFINDYKFVREAHNMPAFSGRCAFQHFADPETENFEGIVFTSGKKWYEQRKFAFSYIQSGFRNARTMESHVREETAKLISDIKENRGQAINLELFFNISVINSLWSIVAGRTYSRRDPDLQKLTKHATAIATSVLLQFLAFYPGVAKRFPKLSGFQMMRYNMKRIHEFMENIVEEHKKTYKAGIQRDFVDAYLQKINNTSDKNSSFYGKLGERNLVFTMADLFSAGTETVSSSLRWVIFLMAHFPEIQNKLIDCIKLQNQGHLALKDRISMPYIEAVIQEVLRFSSLAPLGLFHDTLEDVTFHNYIIPKGTVIVSNQYGILHDPKIWGDPENFRPERFLSNDGTELIQNGAHIIFGVGRRICPGESFARDELFLFMTSIFKKFRVEFDPSLPKPLLKYKVGHILVPIDHQVVFHEIAQSRKAIQCNKEHFKGAMSPFLPIN